eukprot:GHRQ01026279.1.p1 GENE.GHRQ01026279.1~~GHRQ01026279.1.p1  ORF type:complete len:549 (-),score=73.10 GHRQ01026279.1:284-1807(-)
MRSQQARRSSTRRSPNRRTSSARRSKSPCESTSKTPPLQDNNYQAFDFDRILRRMGIHTREVPLSSHTTSKSKSHRPRSTSKSASKSHSSNRRAGRSTSSGRHYSLDEMWARIRAAEAEARAEKATRRNADTALRAAEAARDTALLERDNAAQQLSATTTQLEAVTLERDNLAGKHFITALSKPPHFSGSGEKTLAVRDWLLTVTDYLNSAAIAHTDTQRIRFAETYLTGEAKRSWNTARSSLVQATAAGTAATTTPVSSPTSYTGITWDAFSKSLIDRWDPACTDVKAMHQLEDLRQTGSLQAFISKFDKLCSYVPDMTDREKVYRFLKNCSPAVAQQVSTDPSTRKMWTRYTPLRDYALNFAVATATTTTNNYNFSNTARPNKRRYAEALGQITSMAQHAAGRLGGRRVEPDGRGGYTTTNNGQVSGRRSSSSGSDPFLSYTNANGQRFSRHITLTKWCHGHQVCICCFAKYTEQTQQHHKENCRAAPKPDKALPDGYTIHRRGG